MSRVVVLLATASAVLLAGAAAPSASVFGRCGSATAVDRTAPLGRAIPVRGVLWLAVYPFDPGYPTKAVVVAQRPIRDRVVLRGWDCASGSRLRFWYRDGLPFTDLPVPAASLRATGSLSAAFGPWPARGMHGGYLMFWHSGGWKITVYEHGRLIGSAIVRTRSD
jgi:hypothetical protein